WSFIHKHLQGFLSLLFAVAVALFWAFPYRCALSYQEQYQLFLFTPSYFTERISVPGGLADYVAEFITQFYYVYALGTILLALVFFCLQRLTWVLMRRSGVSPSWYLLSFIPAVALWALMGNENVLLSFAIALLGMEEMMLHYIIVRDHSRGWVAPTVYLLIAIPVGYWLVGPVVIALAMGPSLTLPKREGMGNTQAHPKDSETSNGSEQTLSHAENKAAHKPLVTPLGWTLLSVLYFVAVVWLCGRFLQYPYYKLFGGINYFRYPAVIPVMQWVVVALFALLPLAASNLPHLEGKKAIRGEILQLVVVVLAAVPLLRLSFDRATYELIDYDYLVRTHQWQRIIEKAEKHQASSPMSVSCVNLALAMQGQLCDRLFEFYQNGAEGLFPTFTRDMTSPLPTAEAFYQLGMVNDAERYTFEAQEAIPNYRKSGRLTRRIAQCEIINGNYAVAAKYLRMLENSLFYRQWAKSQERFLYNSAAVKADPEYGRLCDIRIKHHDYLFSDQEMDQMLGLLLVDNKKYDNRMAYEYLIAYELLQRDLDRFMQYYPLGRFVQFDHIPYAIQQVLIGSWLQRHNTLQGMPYSVDRQNVDATVAFIRAYMTNRNDPALNQPPLAYNAWHYLLMSGNTKRKGKEKMRNIY
ncbi:MAG TPA: oxidoreductase, partial [Prevotella sp.]|nr:oxidoreductase [Prevotella sp.]